MSFTSLIVTYNSASEVPDLLADLHLYAPNNPVVLIDNASRDRTGEIVLRQFPGVRLVCNQQNTGYAKAVNLGFDLCDTQYVFLFNPDIRILSSKIFEEAVECMGSSSNIAAVAPLQYSTTSGKSHLTWTWSYFTPQSFKIYWSYLWNLKQDFTQAIPVTFLNAGCLLIRKSAFVQVGKLNEKYFLYGEEPDLFLKFKRYGYQSLLLANTSVIHYRERSMRSLVGFRRVGLKLMAVYNICDALVGGLSKIMIDRLHGRRPDKN